ncbi:RNase J family beta-CASP ribonuclease [Candidatus Saccharibacteria bacterium]|nr:RNase J family beta-CASP ribonuclease [Candidatus Saccharibacteria bacterium]
MNINEEERRARLLKSRAERLPDIKKQFEEAQNRNFNSNFKPGGQDAGLVGSNGSTKGNAAKGVKNAPQGKNAKNSGKKTAKNGGKQAKKQANVPKAQAKAEAEKRKVNLSVSAKKGDMVHHQRMLSQDVNAQATQHIIGLPVNKSRYNGYGGEQITNAKLKQMRPDPEAVRIIPIGGVGEFGIGKNMTIIEYKSEIVVIDMGVLFAGDDYPGVNYLIPDIKYLEDNRDKVKAICFTHAHLDHIGACKHLLPKFSNLTPIYATDFTIGMIKRQMSEVDDAPEMNYQPVDPFKHEIIKVSEHLSVEFVHTLHSIPGNAAIIVRTPNGVVYFSGDWRYEANPMGMQTDYERIDEIVAKEGIDLLVNESTNIDSPGRHPHSEYDVGENLGKVMDHYADGRVIISCFSSQIARIELVLKEAAARGRKVAFSGFSMINNVEVALRAKSIKVPKDTIVKMEDTLKLPDNKVCIVCTGSQGELNAVLNRMVTGAHKYIKIKSTDTVVFSSNPIPGNEPHVVNTVDGLLREGAQVIQNGKTHLTNIGPLHLSGHAYYEDHVDFVTRLHPTNYMPYHGEFYMLEHNAEMAENVVGIPHDRILLADDGDMIELMPDKTIRKCGRIHVGNKLYDDADQPVHEAVVKDRIHISREGIFVIVLTLNKKTGHLMKTPDIVSRAFIYLDNSEELIGKIRHYLRQKTDKSISTDPDMKVLKEEIKQDITHILFDATGHTPIVIPVINKV